MYTYKLTFNNGDKFKLTAKNLDEAHTKIVNYINKNNLTKCLINCPNGIIRRVVKTGQHHWNHPNFLFD